MPSLARNLGVPGSGFRVQVCPRSTPTFANTTTAGRQKKTKKWSSRCGSPGRFALPPSDAPCEAGRANRPGEPRIRVVRAIRCKKVPHQFVAGLAFHPRLRMGGELGAAL